jgi:methionyl-tRNA formyltransferase
MLKIAFAGDRDIAVWVLDYLIDQGTRPLALMVSDTNEASHADELIQRCQFLDNELIFKGKAFRSPENESKLRSLDLDYIVSIHFPYLYPPHVLSIPRVGVLNLHPAFLPYNRGWHTPSWAILDKTPVGATLHFMDESVDTGDIVHQKRVEPSPVDTAHTLYGRLKEMEFEVFKEAWPQIVANTYTRRVQLRNEGTAHKRQDLFSEAVQKLPLDATMTVESVLCLLKALTTNNLCEAAYYEANGQRYRVQVMIRQEEIEA